MIILVTGGRNNDDYPLAEAALAPYAHPGNILINGSAPGWDLTCESAWRSFQLPYIGVPAQWGFDRDKRVRAAGPIRNGIMVDGKSIFPYAELVPDVVIAGEGGRGTADCVDRAERAGIEVLRVGH